MLFSLQYLYASIQNNILKVFKQVPEDFGIMQEQIFDMLFNKDEITWQTIIYELVKTEQMDPWDIDISLLAERFLEKLKALKEMDFRVSGKVLLAAAILLKIKSDKLLTDDIAAFDRLLNATDLDDNEFYEEISNEMKRHGILPEGEEFRLVPRTPQPRKRKVSVYDLVSALNKALEVKNRRSKRFVPQAPEVKIPAKQTDISVVIKSVYSQIVSYVAKQNSARMKFSSLLGSDDKQTKVYTFIPLLHLTNQRKIDLEQEGHFTDFDILVLDPKEKIKA